MLSVYLSVFTQSPHNGGLDFELLTYCVISIIMFILLLEHSLRAVESKLRHFHHYLKILSRVYSELMSLGLVSFGILVVEQIVHLPPSALETLEFSHIWVFFVALSYIGHVLIYMVVTRIEKRKYDKYRNMRPEDIIHEHRMNERERRRGRGRQFSAAMEFHIVRVLFCSSHDLDDSFDFAKYLRKSVSHHITKQLEISKGTWFIIVALLLANLVRLKIMENYDDDIRYHYGPSELWAFFAIAYLLFALNVCLLWSLINVKKRLMTSLGVTGGVRLDGLLAKLINLDQPVRRHRLNYANNIQSRSSNTHARPLMSICTTATEFNEVTTRYLPASIPNLFAFDSPKFYSRSIEFLMVAQNFFLALTLILHLRQSTIIYDADTAALYIFFSLIPQIAILLYISPRSIALYVFVHSTIYVDRHVLSDVLEWTEQTGELRREIKQRIILLCQERGLTLKQLIDDVAAKYSKNDAAAAAQHFLLSDLNAIFTCLDIFLTPIQRRRLTRALNMHDDGRLTFSEFLGFFFHDEDVHARPSELGDGASASGGAAAISSESLNYSSRPASDHHSSINPLSSIEEDHRQSHRQTAKTHSEEKEDKPAAATAAAASDQGDSEDPLMPRPKKLLKPRMSRRFLKQRMSRRLPAALRLAPLKGHLNTTKQQRESSFHVNMFIEGASFSHAHHAGIGKRDPGGSDFARASLAGHSLALESADPLGFTRCFGEAATRCRQCQQLIPAMRLAAHVRHCRAARKSKKATQAGQRPSGLPGGRAFKHRRSTSVDGLGASEAFDAFGQSMRRESNSKRAEFEAVLKSMRKQSEEIENKLRENDDNKTNNEENEPASVSLPPARWSLSSSTLSPLPTHSHLLSTAPHSHRPSVARLQRSNSINALSPAVGPANASANASAFQLDSSDLTQSLFGGPLLSPLQRMKSAPMADGFLSVSPRLRAPQNSILRKPSRLSGVQYRRDPKRVSFREDDEDGLERLSRIDAHRRSIAVEPRSPPSDQLDG